MAAATNTFGSSVFGNAVTQADNVFGKTFSQVDANRQGSFINSFGQSFTPGVTATDRRKQRHHQLWLQRVRQRRHGCG